MHALEKEMATHSSILAWRIPRRGEPGGLPSMGSHRVGHDWRDLAAAAADWSSRLPSLIWVSCIQSVEGLNLTESSPPSKGEFLLLGCFWIGTPVFSCLQTWTETLALPVSWACQPLDWNSNTGLLVLRPLNSEWNKNISSPGSPAWWLTLQILGLACLQNYMSQFHIYINNISPTNSVSLV